MFTNEEWEYQVEFDLEQMEYDVQYVNIKDFWLDLDDGDGAWKIIFGFGTSDGTKHDGVQMSYCYQTEDFLNIEF